LKPKTVNYIGTAKINIRRTTTFQIFYHEKGLYPKTDFYYFSGVNIAEKKVYIQKSKLNPGVKIKLHIWEEKYLSQR